MNHIRLATESDIPHIAEIHVLAWHNAYSNLVAPYILNEVTIESRIHAWTKWMSLDNSEIHVLHTHERMLGFTRICPAMDRKTPPDQYGELTHLYLHPTEVSKGSGHQLFTNAVSRLKKAGYQGMLLWTIEGNSKARVFYESQGMVVDGERDDEPLWLGEGVFEVRYVSKF
ncbi:MAG: GNAT family N-acetyltransferase [Gammaproteobacteria bacterium]|nr:GNAT family N-acetyltransferase [Gammaproteobacteria bacterium]